MPCMTKQGTPVDVKIYPGAAHAFANPSGGSYRPDAAKDAWRRTTAFFAAKVLLKWFRSGTLLPFAIYSLLFGAICAIRFGA